MNTSIQKSALSNTKKQWEQYDWKSIEEYVMKLQQRIYRAEKLGQKSKVRSLQRMLIHSQGALLLSIKRVTQVHKSCKEEYNNYFSGTSTEPNRKQGLDCCKSIQNKRLAGIL